MLLHNLGYPRIGKNRALKKVLENFWAEKINLQQLESTAFDIRKKNWMLQKALSVDWIPSNDFSLYDGVLDSMVLYGAIPERFQALKEHLLDNPMAFYFAMARGYQDHNFDIAPLQLTKWFNTNYHYLVPEITETSSFSLNATSVIQSYKEAQSLGIHTVPVLISPISFLLLSKQESEKKIFGGLEALTVIFIELLKQLENIGVDWVQLEEPFWVTTLGEETQKAYQYFYETLDKANLSVKILANTYFGSIKENLPLISKLPIDGLHFDAQANRKNIEAIHYQLPEHLYLSIGIVDGLNVWKNDFNDSLQFIHYFCKQRNHERLAISPSCSLLHLPYDVEEEKILKKQNPILKNRLAFAKQKLEELKTLKVDYFSRKEELSEDYNFSKIDLEKEGLEHLQLIPPNLFQRKNPFVLRKKTQQEKYPLPILPSTTIGSFPQTKMVRKLRRNWENGKITTYEYEQTLKNYIQKTIQWQEDIGLDVLVHGEYERKDMVEYFATQLDGFTTTEKGWVQSYGSRCVKPPIQYDTIRRKNPLVLKWIIYAQSLTNKPLKAILTGPITLMQWSFIRNDQSQILTCLELARVIRDETIDLEKTGIHHIQIDEPAFREAMPLQKTAWQGYFDWAIPCFQLASCGVGDATTIHTHMCYSNFNDIMAAIAKMDADVITIETTRSLMKLLKSFSVYAYPNDIGPGVYDVHATRIPTTEDMIALIQKAKSYIPENRLWVNPDCGLKTRGWKEVEKAIPLMIEAAKTLRKELYQAQIAKQ